MPIKKSKRLQIGALSLGFRALFAIFACRHYFVRNQNGTEPKKSTSAGNKMQNPLKFMWGEILSPLLQRPNRLQVAALCYRSGKQGREVLVITSRDTGRWIIPKGWPMRGKDSSEAALAEAWEEAGVRVGHTEKKAVGRYRYEKRKSTGWSQSVTALVFPVEVKELADQFPEASERRRKWVSPIEAANLVSEPGLKRILQSF